MKVRFLGAHNLESRDTRLACALIDGVIALDAGGITSSMTFEEQLRLKAVLVTHHHYDHIKDLPMIGLTFQLQERHLQVCSIKPVYEALRYLLSYPEKMYTNVLEKPTGDPTIRFSIIEPLKPFAVRGYEITVVPVNHSVPAVGYEVTGPDGRKLFYTGDTGPGLEECWRHTAPDLLIVECTGIRRLMEEATRSKHLAPVTLREELLSFRKLHGYVPSVITTHMYPEPQAKAELERELARLAAELGADISPAYEGMEMDV